MVLHFSALQYVIRIQYVVTIPSFFAGKYSLNTKQQFLSYVCEMYLQFLSIMKNSMSDILIGLGCNDTVVFKIWCFFKETTMLDIKKILGMKSYISVLSLLSQMMLYMLK